MTTPDNPALGVALAVGCTVAWCGSAIAFEAAGRRVGSLAVNLLRFLIALPLLALLCVITTGQVIPDAPVRNLVLIALSGVVGFFIGDLMLFRAFVVIGSQKAITVMATTPIITAALAWAILGQTLSPVSVIGIALTLAGVFTAVSEKPPTLEMPSPDPHSPESTTLQVKQLTHSAGLLLALGGAVAQAVANIMITVGQVLPDGSKTNPMAGTFVRGVAGATCFLVLVLLTRQTPRIIAGVKNLRAMQIITIGAISGPVIGVSLLLAAFQHASAAVVSTITATQPILMIPAVWYFRGKRPTHRGILGAVLALFGVAVLMLGDTVVERFFPLSESQKIIVLPDGPEK